MRPDQSRKQNYSDFKNRPRQFQLPFSRWLLQPLKTFSVCVTKSENQKTGGCLSVKEWRKQQLCWPQQLAAIINNHQQNSKSTFDQSLVAYDITDGCIMHLRWWQQQKNIHGSKNVGRRYLSQCWRHLFCFFYQSVVKIGSPILFGGLGHLAPERNGWRHRLDVTAGILVFRLGSKPEHVEETHDNTLRTRRLQHRKDPSHTETEPRTSSLRDHGGFLVNTRSSCSIWRYKMFLHLFMPPKNLQLFHFVFIAAGERKKNN